MEKVQTDQNSVYCYGKEAPYDHPKIYLKIDPKLGYITCPYCSKRFAMKGKN